MWWLPTASSLGQQDGSAGPGSCSGQQQRSHNSVEAMGEKQLIGLKTNPRQPYLWLGVCWRGCSNDCLCVRLDRVFMRTRHNISYKHTRNSSVPPTSTSLARLALSHSKLSAHHSTRTAHTTLHQHTHPSSMPSTPHAAQAPPLHL